MLEDSIQNDFRFRQQEEFMRRSMDNSEDSTQPVSASSSISECPPSPFTHDKNQMDVDSVHSQEVESLKRILQEVNFK